MALDQQTAMTDAEVDTLLGRHETGVLSLAKGGDPYTIPISYGYDADARQFYMRLVSTPGSEKREFLESEPACRLVVYEDAEPTYRSVIAKGTLEAIPREELTAADIEQFGQAKRPLFEIWSEARSDLDIQLFRLRPTDLSGRRIELDR